MSKLDLGAIEALCAAAHPGPWDHFGGDLALPYYINSMADGETIVHCSNEEFGVLGRENAALLSQSRTLIPALVAELREHREAIEALGAVYAIPSGPMDAVQQFLLYVKERDARVRDAENLAGDYSKQIHDLDGELAILILARDFAIARVRALEGERSKETMGAIVRVLELEEEAVGLKADLAEALGRLDEMGAR